MGEVGVFPRLRAARVGAWLAWICLTALACDPRRLCDGGACETLQASRDGGDAAWVPAASRGVDASAAPGLGVSGASGNAAGSSMDAAPVDAPALACEPDAGCPAGGVCHPYVRVCVECISDEQCSDPSPFCLFKQNPAKNECVGCLTTADCAEGLCVDQQCVDCDPTSNVGCEDPTPLCSGESGSPRCVQCGGDEDCTAPEAPVCEPATGTCVACLTNGEGCAEGERCAELVASDLGDGDVGGGDVGRSDAALPHAPPERRCIECTVDSAVRDCRADTPYCIDGRCSMCDPELEQGCGGIAPYCRSGAELAAEADSNGSFGPGVCAQCRNDDDCTALNPYCIAGVCEECRVDANCPDAAASSCDPSLHQCVPCANSGQCKHVDGAPVCHVGAASDSSTDPSRCVECNALDYRACDAAKNACVTVPSAAQFTCSDHPVNQVGFCETCVADADCSAHQRCVARDSNASSQPRYYCLYLLGSAGGPSSCADTDAPFTRPVEATSVDGATGTYCALGTTTCGVFRRYNESCTGDGDCGNPEDGATCYPAGGGRCTYPCTLNADCPDGACVENRCQVSAG